MEMSEWVWEKLSVSEAEVGDTVKSLGWSIHTIDLRCCFSLFAIIYGMSRG